MHSRSHIHRDYKYSFNKKNKPQVKHNLKVSVEWYIFQILNQDFFHF